MTDLSQKQQAKRKGLVLGRGLGNLLSVDEETRSQKEKQGILDIDISYITTDKQNPRKKFSEKAIEELAGTIKQYGLLQPILVIKDRNFYQVVSGERRLRACRLLDLKKVPCIVKQLSIQEKLEVSLIENIQREQLDPIEEAVVYKSLIEEHSLTQEEVSTRVGKNRATIANRIRLLRLPEKVQVAIANGDLTEGQVRPLLTIKDENKIKDLVAEIIRKNLSVRIIEDMIKKEQKKLLPEKVSKKDPDIVSLENQLESLLGTHIQIDHDVRKNRGRIIIKYFSLEDFDRILNLLKK